MTTLIIEEAAGPDITGEPLELDEVKLHLKVEHTEDDLLISSLIIAAREQAEHMTGRLYAVAERTMVLDAFPSGSIRIPFSPLVSVDEITYTDSAGDEQVFEDFGVTLGSPGYLFAAPGFSWPTAYSQPGSVVVTYTAGVSAGSVPELVKAWMKLTIGALYTNREAWTLGKAIEQNPFIDRLLDRERILTVV